MEKDYFAFISYQRKDEQWAEWLLHQLEHYHLPSNVITKHPELPKELRPLFLDKNELAGGILPKEIRAALESSRFLIVICSPNSANSEWVNKEVMTFIELGRTEKIIPFIIDGTPYDKKNECFTPALQMLKKNKQQELLGINIAEMGREVASIKVVARMLGLKFDTLWQRYEREKAEEERKVREQRDNLLRVQSRFLSEKVNELVEDGDNYTARLLALETLPPDRPWTPEAEAAFRNACQNNSAVLKGHSYVVSSVEFSPDNKQIVSTGWDLSTYVWDVSSGCGTKINETTATHASGQSCFSPDGKHILTVGFDIKVFDAQSLGLIKVLDIDDALITSASYSPDGKRIFVSTYKKLLVFDTSTYRLLSTLNISSDGLTKHAFSPDGNKLCCFGAQNERGEASIVDVNSGKKLLSIREESIEAVSFSPDGNLVATASWNGTAKLWDSHSGVLVKEIPVSDSVVNDIAFSPDGDIIASASWDGVVSLWDVSSGELLAELSGHNNRVLSLSFSNDGERLASSSWDNTIRIWDLVGNQYSISDINPSFNNKSFLSPDGEKVAIVSWGEPVKVINKKTGDTICQLPKDTWQVHTADFSPDNKTLITASQDHTVRVWNALNGKELKKFEHGAIVYTAVSSPDGIHIASGTDIPDRKIRIWNLQTEQLEETIDALQPIYSLAYSPDGKHLACVLSDGILRVYDTTRWVVLLELYQPIDVNDDSFVKFEGSCLTITSDSKKYSLDFPPLQTLIDQTREQFKNRQLTKEEKAKYYLE